MNPSVASVARGAIVAIVILLAALAGLVAGNAINPENRDLAPGAGRVFANVWGNHADSDTTAPMAQDRVYENVWGNHADADTSAAGAPAYADPYRQIIQDAGTSPTAQDRVYENVWGNHADADEPPDASLTRPTLR